MINLAEPPQAEADQFKQVLLESRRRWRDFGALAADLAFEVDQDGVLTFIAPEELLGVPADTLLGQRAATLFFPREGKAPDPFLLTIGFRQRRSWVQGADGRQICLALSCAPVLDPAGRCLGARAVGIDVTAREQRDMLAAAALRRVDVLDHILDQMRQEVLAPRIMAAMLKTTLRAVGGAGAVVLDLAEQPEAGPVLHSIGELSEGLVQELRESLACDQRVVPFPLALADGVNVLNCRSTTRFGQETALAIWREQRERPWDADDMQLLGSVTALVRMALEHETIQRELARQARTDSLTGLLNRRAFIEEAQRRIERLEREALPGTLMFVDLDRLKPLNDRLGHEAGDAALVFTSHVLRRMVRPSDLVARLGGDEFALWLDGFDSLTAAERAESLRLNFPREAADYAEPDGPGLSMSIGIACRQPGEGEELEDIIQRADLAMYEVKRNGGGHWRVSNAERAL